MKKTLSLRHFSLTSAAMLALGLASSLHASTTWDGTGANTNIDTQENWDDDLNPTLTGGTSTLTFGSGGATATINTNVNVAGIVFNRDANFEIADGAGTLTIGSGGITMSLPTTTARTHTISESSLLLGASQIWTLNNNTGTARLNVSSVIDDGASTFALTKAGTGLLVLSNSNTFGGNVTVTAGTLRLAHSNAAGTGTKTIVMQGGSRILELSNGITLGSTISMTLSSNSADGSGLSSVDGFNTIQGNINYSTGNPALNISSSAGSRLTIQGNITLSTTTRTLYFGGASTENNTVSGVIGTTSGVLPVTKQGLGTWSFTNNNSYDGLTSVNNGVLNIRHANALGAITQGTTVATGAALQLQGGITTAAEALSLSGTGISNSGALRSISGTNVYSGAITLAAASRINADADSLTLNVASGNAITATDLDVTFGGAGNIGVSDPIALGAGKVTKDGAGELTFNANNTYTGTTTVDGGRLIINANQTNNGAVIINTGGTVKMSGTRTLKSGTNVAVNTGGTWLLDGTSQTVGELTGAGTIDMGYTAVGTDTLTVGSGDVSSTFSGVIQEAAVVTTRVIALTKTGTGTLTLSGANTHGGKTTINDGILRISNVSALGDTTAGTSISGGTATGRLELSGGLNFAAEGVEFAGRSTDAVHLSNLSGNNTWNGAITTATSGNIYSIESQADKLTIAGTISVNQTGTRVLNLSGAGNGEVTGIISGSGSNDAQLVKAGAGTWTLSNANTYTGTTTVKAGTLALGASGSVSSTSIVVGDAGSSGALFDVSAKSGSYTLATGNTLSGKGTVKASSASENITITGAIAPGNGTGIDKAATFTLDSKLTWNGDSAYNATNAWKFDLVSPGPSSDKVVINGDFLKGTGTVFSFDFLGAAPDLGTYTLLDWGGTTGSGITASMFDYGSTLSGRAGSYFTVNGTQLDFTVIPEVSNILVCGLLGAGLLRRRRSA